MQLRTYLFLAGDRGKAVPGSTDATGGFTSNAPLATIDIPRVDSATPILDANLLHLPLPFNSWRRAALVKIEGDLLGIDVSLTLNGNHPYAKDSTTPEEAKAYLYDRIIDSHPEVAHVIDLPEAGLVGLKCMVSDIQTTQYGENLDKIKVVLRVLIGTPSSYAPDNKNQYTEDTGDDGGGPPVNTRPGIGTDSGFVIITQLRRNLLLNHTVYAKTISDPIPGTLQINASQGDYYDAFVVHQAIKCMKYKYTDRHGNHTIPSVWSGIDFTRGNLWPIWTWETDTHPPVGAVVYFSDAPIVYLPNSY